MFGNHYYHKKIHQTTAIFGTLFNNINVIRADASGGTLSEQRVPLAYGTREKWLERIEARPDNLNEETTVAIKMPRIGFAMVGLVYDSTRKLNQLSYCSIPTTDGRDTKRHQFYSGVPYLMSFQLSILTKTQDEMFQIAEQILPNFQPSFTVKVKPFPDHPTITEDLTFILRSVSMEDVSEGAMTDRNVHIWTLDFDAQINLFSSLNDSTAKAVIKEVDINFKTNDDELYLNIDTVPDPTDAEREAWESAGEPVTVSYTYTVNE